MTLFSEEPALALAIIICGPKGWGKNGNILQYYKENSVWWGGVQIKRKSLFSGQTAHSSHMWTEQQNSSVNNILLLTPVGVWDRNPCWGPDNKTMFCHQP